MLDIQSRDVVHFVILQAIDVVSGSLLETIVKIATVILSLALFLHRLKVVSGFLY